jgi:ZIP family zinc transporter
MAPESIVIGVSMIWGAVSWVAVVAIFLSNLPEGLSSSTGMKKAGRSATYVFGVWTSIAVISRRSRTGWLYTFQPLLT